MLSKKEIENAKECVKEIIQNTYAEGKAINLNNALEYINQLETKVKELAKGQQELMQSRRKWKRRYYNLKNKNKKLKDKLIGDKMEQLDDYIIYLLESYLDIIK